MTTLPWTPIYPIVTERLVLRPHRDSDLDDLLEFHSDPEVVRYIPWPVQTREQVRVALDLRVTADRVEKEGDWLILAMELRETGRVIGEVLLKCSSIERGEAELGYAVHAGFHGRGLASEAARAMLALGFGELGLRRVTAELDARNTASAKLLERLGFTLHRRFATEFKGEQTEDLEYALEKRSLEVPESN